MAKYSAVKATVNAYIKQNGRKEITGRILNAVLNATIDSLGRFFQFAGGAMPTDDPGTPDQNVCYLAGEPGVYTNFGGITIENEEVALLFWDGEWTKQRILIGIREVNASVDNQVGTPSVDVSYSGGELVLTFHNLKGEQGETGDPAGFGTIGADINGGVGTPGVSVETSGDNTAKNLMFHFTNLKGETGVTSVVATIDNTSGTPSCQVSLVGQQLTLAFSGLKGLKGDTGVSADYPITIYNGLDSDATDQALAAAQGKVLDGKVSQLGQEIHPIVTTDGMEIALIAVGPINADGSITSSNTRYRRCTITNDGYTRISGHGSSYTGYLILAFYNSASPSAASFISGIAATHDYVDQSFDVSVPAGTVTIIVSYSTNGSATQSTITLYKPSNILETLEDGLQAVSDDVDILKPTVEGLGAGLSAMVGTYTPAGWTALAWGTVVSGKYWNIVDGEAGLVSASDYYANPSLLPINPGRTVKATVKNANIPFGESSAAISLYDNDGLPAYVPGQGIARWNWGNATTKVDNGDGTSTYTFLIPSGATQIGLYYKIDEVTFYISNPESISYSEGLDQHIEEVAGGGVTTSADSAKYYLKGASPKSFPSAKKIAILCAGQSNAEGRVPYANMPAEIQSAQPITNCHYVEDSESGAFVSLNITGQWAFDLVTYYNLCITANKEIYVMKWAAGGTSIDPLGDGTYHWTADYEDLSSPGYSLLRKFEAEIRNHIATDGENFAIRAMLWHQGEGDRGSLGTGSADRYYENLRNMVSYIRGIVGDERLPFITGTISHNSAQYDAEIEAAQQRIASEDPYFCLIDMSGAPLLDSYHFNAASSVYFGEMAYNALIDFGVLSATKLTPTRPW